MALADHTVQVRDKHSGCESTSWMTDSSVKCFAGGSVSVTHRFLVSIQNNAGTVTETFSIDRAIQSSSMAANQHTTGTVSLTVQGLGF
eukprot:463943-Hanusia_phi.AAC.1